VKILFIAGAGRSGSTILDNTLGQFPGLVTAGEVRYVWERGLIENRLCGCGERFRDCPFWTGVVKGAFGDPPDVDPRRMMALQQRGTRIRHLPLLLGGQAGRRALARRMPGYVDALARLYGSIATSAGARVVVDSSKLPAYGRILESVPGVELYVVHLVRDPRATAYSWGRRKTLPDRAEGGYMQRQPPWRSTLLWTVWNAVAEMMWRRRRGRYLLVRYEDLVREPRSVVEGILRLVGESPEGSPFRSDSVVELAATHTAAGNPSRLRTGPVEIRPDEEWRAGLPGRARVLVTALSLPLLRRYGYPSLGWSAR
jgi:hypothetical protein